MAETDLHTTAKNNNNVPANATKKIYNHFLYKAVFLSILFLLVIPLFPWQANPDSEKTNSITSSSWELLQLVFVGIAVSYGVFSKLNDETPPKCEKEEEEGSSTHTYVSRLLQVSSSVFDDGDDDDLARGHGSHEKDSSKRVVQTWNSQYHRGEPPMIVVAKESSSNDHHPPPLLLPVRSLKNKASESSSSSSMIYDDSKLLNNTSSSKSLRRFSSSRSRSKSKFSGDAEEEDTVLRSPIPWRSRSGRMMTGIESTLPISSSNPLSPSQIQSQEEDHDVGPKHTSPVPPPPPPPPPPPHSTKINTYFPHKELRRTIPKYEDLNNRGGSSSSSRRGAIRTQSDTSPRPKFFTTEYLSQDKEIERFIERRGSKKKFFINDDGDDDDDDHDGKPQKFTENPKEIFMETPSKDSDDESEVEEHEEEELQELASKKNVESIMDNVGPDVDKKADEFIAKFREQIRLQRIASIRTTTSLLKPTKNVP